MEWTALRWERLAEPQADEYDTETALCLAAEHGLALPVGGSDRKIFDGVVGLEVSAEFGLGRISVLDEACGHVRLWPTCFRQFQRLVSRVNVRADFCGEGASGASSSAEGGFGRVTVTLGDPVGVAEGLVFGLALHKLAAFGVGPESGGKLVAEGELVPGPLRLDAPCRASEALCQLYGTAYRLQLDAIMAETQPRLRRRIAQASVAWTFPRLIFGRRVIGERARLLPAGKAFAEGLNDWLQRIEEQSLELLAEEGVASAVFSHPFEICVCGEHRPRHCDGVQGFGMDEEMLLYAPGHAKAYTLNPSARVVWDLCDGSRTVAEMADLLERELERPEGSLHDEVSGAVQTFVQSGLVTTVPPEPES